MSRYTIHSGNEFDGDSCYSVLKCWLTEPEDRSWSGDGSKVIERLEQLEEDLAEARQAAVTGRQRSVI